MSTICRLHVVDQFYDTLTLGVVCLSEVIVVKFYIIWRIFVCILESIDDEFVALVYSPPHGIASMTGIRCTCITCIRNNLIITKISTTEKSADGTRLDAFEKQCFAYSFRYWQPPTFPYRYQYSIIGRLSLNHRVRDVDGCFP